MLNYYVAHRGVYSSYQTDFRLGVSDCLEKDFVSILFFTLFKIIFEVESHRVQL